MEPRERLAQAVKERRLALGISVAQAADRAEIARNTWISMETGTRQISERQHAAVERVLGWPSPAIAKILRGDYDAPPSHLLQEVEPPAARSLDLLTEAERINGLPLPAEDRLAMVLILIRAHSRVSNPGTRTVGKRRAS